MILDEISAAVASQLDQQAASGVRIVEQDEVPDTGPVHGGVWLQIPEVTAVFVDVKGSTGLNTRLGAETAAHAYNYFNRAMAVILDGFQARYVDVQGDGLFGLFSGRGSRFLAAACAITMKTQIETVVAEHFRRDVRADWELRAGIGVDRGKLLVRQLGIRGTGMNEVWAGTPVNMAAKLSGVAGPNEVAVSERVFSEPVYNLFRISTVKASTTICRLVLSFLSQFFQSRRHFSSQAKDRSTTHRFGSTTKVCSSLRFTTSTEAPNRPCTAVAKGFPV